MSTLSARLPAWAREPLLHFVVLGALLFGVDHALSSRPGDPRVIVVDAAVDGEARRVFKEARGRDPNTEELYALRRVWLDNEVLYREGLALGVDKGDPMIRERVIFKALSIVSADLQQPPIDDAGLRAWFEKNRARYGEPARYDFQEAVPAGDSSEGAVRALVETLRNGTPGELSAGLRIFKGRPHANLLQGYGEDFAAALVASAPGQWRALKSRDAWRAVQLVSAAAAKPADYEPLRGVVLHDWTDAIMAEQRSAAVHALARKYTVKVETAK
jgi:hypothetical protein